MKVLLDEMVPHDLRHELRDHHVETVAHRGWQGLSNGDLLQKAEDDYDVFVTADKGLPHEQNMVRFDIGVIVLPSNRMAELLPKVPTINRMINTVPAGSVTMLE